MVFNAVIFHVMAVVPSVCFNDARELPKSKRINFGHHISQICTDSIIKHLATD